MEKDSYRVQVLHYLNPHLIWVEVLKNDDEILFEQVGIYGVLPLETTIDIEGTLETHRCDEWAPAAIVLMKNLLCDAEEVWFRPTYIDRKSSIFDDNIHKYGDLIIKRPSSKLKSLTKYLSKSGFAFHDDCAFHQELSLGKIKTKLDSGKIKDVVKHLEGFYNNRESSRKWEKSVKNQMTVFEMGKALETKLTRRNLDKFTRENKDVVLENKKKDFDMCKDVDEASIGRACSKKNQNEALSSKLLKKKFEHVMQKNNECESSIFMATKKLLDRVGTTKNEQNNIVMDISAETYQENSFECNNGNLDENIGTHEDFEEDSPKAVEDPTFCSPYLAATSSFEVVTHAKTHKKNTHKKQKVPDYDVENEMRVAYGPPDFNRMKLPTKIVPKSEFDEAINIKPNEIIDDDVEEIPKRDMFADVDSNINIVISNVDILKNINENDCRVRKAASPKLIKEADQLDSVVKKNNIETVKPFYGRRVKSEKIKADEVGSNNLDNNKCEVESPKTDLNVNIDDLGKTTGSSPNTVGPTRKRSLLLQRQLKLHKAIAEKKHDSSTSSSDTTNKDTSSSEVNKTNKKDFKEQIDSDDDTVSDIIEKMKVNHKAITPIKESVTTNNFSDGVSLKNNVNPFKNLDGSTSVFVEKLVSPVLMVHTKKDNRIQPRNLRDLPFGTNIQVSLKNMNIKEPTRLQTVTWATILRGYSVFTISPLGSGKTIGYLPAVCRLVSDSHKNKDCVGPSCIIVCATAEAVSAIEKQAKMFLGLEEKVLACYAGMDDLAITTSLLNGCDLLISTPLVLVRLMHKEFGVDIRQLTTLVLDDCERLSEVYASEIKVILFFIKEMLKNRANKELKVQIIVASRIWCDFMRPLALKAPDTLICIGAFQECVLYSKANTTVNYVQKENKLNMVKTFLTEIDGTKKTVIVCRSDDEVELLEKALKLKYVVFACNSTMTVHDLYNLNVTWGDYQEPLLGPILVCCDDNLIHLNVTDANYLLHYSMPQLFSMFCKRFSVLNDTYGSIFKTDNEVVKINILLEESNVEQLPKILNFVKRCSYEVPEALDNVCKQVLAEKDLVKAKCFVPVCDNLLALGECPDFWNCEERHAVIKEFDEPYEWVPKTGVITFKILHYHTAVLYSARLLSNVTKGNTKKFSQTYSSLSLKMGMHFSKEANKQLHGIPKIGDVCAVSLKQNFFARCQVLKILNHYQTGQPNYVLIKLIDEEKYEKSRDIHLYHLPDELKDIETYVVHVRLANIQPQDRDITFSDMVMQNLKRITDKDEELYMRGQVVLTIGNCVFVDTLEACQDLSSLNETVVKHNFKRDLLDTHALPNDDHITRLKKLAKDIDDTAVEEINSITDTPPLKQIAEVRWAHLDTDDFSSVFFASAETPENFFVRLTKFEDCINVLIKDINQYVKENPEPVKQVKKGDIVLAMFPDDSTFERARIDEVINANKVKCFFVDQGDWRDVAIEQLIEITDAFITKLPFQAIECRLIGVKPAGDDWAEFSINWFYDKCFNGADLKYLFLKYFTKEKAESTGGYKYGVVLVDTNTNEDEMINKLIIDLNFAQENEDEFDYINQLDLKRELDSSVDGPKDKEIKTVIPYNCNNNNIPQQKPLRNGNYIHNFDISDSDSECDVNMDDNLLAMAQPLLSGLCQKFDKPTPQITADEFNERLNRKVPRALKNIEELSDTKPKALDSKKEEIPIEKPKDLDSDDLTTPDGSEVCQPGPPTLPTQVDELRKPKLLWRQNKTTVTLKILLIGVEKYELVIDERSLRFDAESNDTKYGFEFELYGVIDTKKSANSNRGQYILISLCKVMQRNWLTLTKDGGIRKWIVYDIDSIDTSSEEEDAVDDSYINTLKHIHNKIDSDSEDDDFIDDANFTYRK